VLVAVNCNSEVALWVYRVRFTSASTLFDAHVLPGRVRTAPATACRPYCRVSLRRRCSRP